MQHPVAIIGAGPIGLAAAANAAERGLDFVVLEAGPDAGAAVGEWAHVRLFSAWRELVDPAARRLLEAAGTWTAPDEDTYPTGGEWREAYLQPLADLLDASPGGSVRYGTRVVGVEPRRARPARRLRPRDRPVRRPRRDRRRATSGCWPAPSSTPPAPGPSRTRSVPTATRALGEREHADRISYGIPDFNDPAVAARYAGKHVAVAGKGASAQGVLIGLAKLAERGRRPPGCPGCCAAPASATRSAAATTTSSSSAASSARTPRPRPPAGMVTNVTQFRTESVTAQADGRLTHHLGQRPAGRSTSTRSSSSPGSAPTSRSSPRCASTSTRRSAPHAFLADQIHPDHHSCGDVQPHGYQELAQPEQGLYLVGMKSYGRAPSFLAMTGFEQVRSVVAALAGDLEAADRVDLVLPETGVCNGAGAFDDPDAVAGPAAVAAAPRPPPSRS